MLRASTLITRGSAPRAKDYVASFAPPSAEAILNATKQLRPIRNLVSPVFFSTRSHLTSPSPTSLSLT